MKGRTLSNQNQKIVKRLLNKGSRTISDADRARAEKLLEEATKANKTVSDYYTLKLNDGGIARKIRVF